MKCIYSFLIILLCNNVNGQFTQISNYITSVGHFFGYGKDNTRLLDDSILNQNVPYEIVVADENFISEAARLTDVTLSELDTCQHKVVLKLHTSCDKMNDEQLAKMAVMLLNCQSMVEGRTMYPCTESMSIKECTINMDSDTWNSYHLMSNRARAVCYSIRQVQFRGLTEYTINKLMDAARSQLSNLEKLSTDQKHLHNMAEASLHLVSKGQKELAQQQKDFQMANLHGQLVIEDNIKRIVDEKRLIVETNNELTKMAQNMQHKLKHAVHQLEQQTSESKTNHKELLEDLTAIQDKAEFIFQRIDTSAQLLIKQSEIIQNHYKITHQQLIEVNNTVYYLVNLVSSTKQSLEDHVHWLSNALGGTDLAIENLYTLIWHVFFIIFGMIGCAFFNARPVTRFVITFLPIFNIFLLIQKNNRSLDFITLCIIISTFIIGEIMIYFFVEVWNKDIPQKIKNKFFPKKLEGKSETVNKFTDPTTSNNLGHQYSNSFSNETFDEDNLDSVSVLQFGRLSSKSRSRTPSKLFTNNRVHCNATTRMGTPCKLTSLPGREYCYRHQAGDSIVVE